MSKQGIAIFHNFMDNIGGAEKATLTMARELDADIYTTNIDKEKIKKLGFKTDNIFSIGRVPTNPPWRQQFTQLRFRFARLPRRYNFYIISGDWAQSAAVRYHPNMWYVYSPPRELWDLYEYTKKNIVKKNRGALGGVLFALWVRYNRFLMYRYCKWVDTFVPTSENVRKRVKKFLKKDGVVIHPPIDVRLYRYEESGDFWLSVNRLTPHKRIDVQLKTFSMLPDERLIIVGSYEQAQHFKKYKKYIQSLVPDNVMLLHWIDDEEIRDLYARCRGLICTAMDEDFGLTPLEAMASGKPIIAVNEGGYKETVVHGQTGLLIDNITPKALADAIQKMRGNYIHYKDTCVRRAQEFDSSRFVSRLLSHIYETTQK